MRTSQPYMYESFRPDSFSSFDPKAVTRASFEVTPKKQKKKKGPLLSFNIHPDAQQLPPSGLVHFRPMSQTTKQWIKRMRHVMMVLRGIELVTAAGLLVLMILISDVDTLTAWVLRITAGVVGISCVYAIHHLSRPPGRRPPASSAAYQLFAAFADLATLPLYTFGVMAKVHNGSKWSTILADKSLLAKYFEPTFYYMLMSACGLHLVTLLISCWLGAQFRRISLMPPDMNPLEDNLTSRHKRNKSSIGTEYSYISEASACRLSTPLEDLSRPPSIPFMHTRTGSRDSTASSSKRDSRIDLPSRQYQIKPGNTTPRSSIASAVENRLSKPPSLSTRGSYTEVPLQEASSSSPRPNTATGPPPSSSSNRMPKFSEAWYASESLIQRTKQRERAMKLGMSSPSASASASKPRAYEALSQRYDVDSDGDSDQENDDNVNMRPDAAETSDSEDASYALGSSSSSSPGKQHPNPLRSHPTPLSSTLSFSPSKLRNSISRIKSPFRDSGALSEISLNSRTASGSQDITDAGTSTPGSKGYRKSSIQPESAFYSKPYGEIRPSTPPVLGDIPAAHGGSGGRGSGTRQVSTGNDYDLGAGAGKGYRRNRNVSGKVVEEGRAGMEENRYSRFSILNEL